MTGRIFAGSQSDCTLNVRRCAVPCRAVLCRLFVCVCVCVCHCVCVCVRVCVGVCVGV